MPYSTYEMFSLVSDVESYPEFLPWCAAARIEQPGGRAEKAVRASLVVARGPLRKSFTTLNHMTPDRSIEMQLVDGPFRHLEGRWDFRPENANGCQVRLELEFELAGRIMQKLLGPVFHEIANSLVEAFCRRARCLYDKS